MSWWLMAANPQSSRIPWTSRRTWLLTEAPMADAKWKAKCIHHETLKHSGPLCQSLDGQRESDGSSEAYQSPADLRMLHCHQIWFNWSRRMATNLTILSAGMFRVCRRLWLPTALRLVGGRLDSHCVPQWRRRMWSPTMKYREIWNFYRCI